ncbi:hypothetical protein [Alkalicoccobacillus porphyridii]|nr:hypothetical protein [Alkalicoccobacillus porphyridii]
MDVSNSILLEVMMKLKRDGEENIEFTLEEALTFVEEELKILELAQSSIK